MDDRCELSALQKTLYLQTENHLLMRQGADGGASQTKIANRQAQLKKVLHPSITCLAIFRVQFCILPVPLSSLPPSFHTSLPAYHVSRIRNPFAYAARCGPRAERGCPHTPWNRHTPIH